MKKKLLVILSRYIFPIDSGRKESLHHYLSELYYNYNYEIKMMCFLEKSQLVILENQPQYINEVIVLKDVAGVEKVKNIIKYSLSRKKWPFQCSLFYSVDNSKMIEKVINEWNPDVIFTEMIRTCSYYKSFQGSRALKLANLDDLLSLRYKRQLQQQRVGEIAGNYSRKLPKFLARLIKSKFLRNRILSMESRRCDKWEREYYQLYDYVLLTSRKECDLINQTMKSDKAKVLSVGIDYEYYSEALALDKDPVGLAFIGNFNVAANLASLEMIIEKVLPTVKSKYHFYVIGTCPESIVRTYSSDKIIFIGRVDDTRKYIKQAAIFLSPLAYGTGIKTKIVEAMAMGMPIITNSVGVEGIDVTSGKEVIIIDEWEKIGESVDLLLNNCDMQKKLSENASKFAYDHYRWEIVFQVYNQIGL